MLRACLAKKIRYPSSLRTHGIRWYHVKNFSYICKQNAILKNQSLRTSLALSSKLCDPLKVRQKYTKSSKNDNDSDSEDDEPEFKDEQDSKIVKARVNSLRADILIRAGLNIARNKVEVIFYESKIRVNGKKLLKKSAQLKVGDEIDVIKSVSKANPSHLAISRILILSAEDKEDSIGVNLRRFKNMIIENYKGIDTYKSSES